MSILIVLPLYSCPIHRHCEHFFIPPKRLDIDVFLLILLPL